MASAKDWRENVFFKKKEVPRKRQGTTKSRIQKD